MALENSEIDEYYRMEALATTLDALTDPGNIKQLRKFGGRVVSTCMDVRLLRRGPYQRHRGGGIGLGVGQVLSGRMPQLDAAILDLPERAGVIPGGHTKVCAFDKYLVPIVGKVADSDPRTLALASSLIDLTGKQHEQYAPRAAFVQAGSQFGAIADRADGLRAQLADHEPGRLITMMDAAYPDTRNVLEPYVEASPAGYVIDVSRAAGHGFDGTDTHPNALAQVYLDEPRHTVDFTLSPDEVAATMLAAAATRMAVEELHPGLPTFVITGTMDRGREVQLVNLPT